MTSKPLISIPAACVIPVFLLIVFLGPVFIGPPLFHALQHFDVVFHRAMNRALSFSALVALFVFRRRLKIRQWWPMDRGAAWQFALGWFIALVSAQLMLAVFLSIRGVESTGTPWEQSLLIAAIAALIVPMLEETIFRGFLVTTLAEAAGPRAAWFIGALIYALAHFLKVPSEYHPEPVTLLSGGPAMLAAFTQLGTGDFLGGRGINLFVIGLVLNGVFLRVGRLWLCAGLHGGWIFVLMSFSALTRPVWYHHAPWYARGDLLGSPVTTAVVIAVGLFLWRYYPPRSDEAAKTGAPERLSARLILLDERDRVLLFRFVFKRGALAGQDYWATPGGGVDEGETFAQAARRELFEEVGVSVEQLGGEIAQKTIVLPMTDGRHLVTDERYFLVRLDRPTISKENWTATELEVMTEHRWWSIEDLQATRDVVFPENLIGLLRDLGVK